MHRSILLLVAFAAAVPALAEAVERTLPPDPAAPDGPVECSWVPDGDLERRFGGFYVDFWTNGTVPIVFEEGSTSAVRADTLTDVSFTIPFSGPRLTTNVDFDRGFAVGDVLRVSGSQRNDNRDLIITNLIDTGNDPNAANIIEVDLLPNSTFSAEQPDGLPVIVFSTETVSALNQQRFLAAAQRWESEADVQFVTYVPGVYSSWVRVKNFDRNRVDGAGMASGENTLFMDNWPNQITLLHELAHELGAKHEHQRPDRNTYVTINTQNVDPDFIGNFNLDNSMDVYPPTIYDFGSIMHYGQNAFRDANATGVTISVNAPWTTQWQTRIGRATDLSFWDRKTMSFMYPENDWRFVFAGTSSSTRNGGFRTPYDDWSTAYGATPSGGRLIASEPATYVAPGIYSKRVLIEAPLGGVLLRGN